MARTKSFDRDAVLDRAMDLFWKQGYEATSVQELVEATGINRGSMYDTFGDKRDLFIAALTRYADRSAENRLKVLKESEAPLDGIRNFFDAIIDAAGEEETERLGCLMTNSTVEMSVRDPEIGDLLRDRLAQVENAFARSLRKAQRRGDLHKGHKARALARFLTGTIQGIRVLSRAGAEREALADIVDVAMSHLDGPPVEKKKAVIDRGAR